MNERIKELAEQASKLARAEHPELANGMTMNQISKSNVKTYMVTEYDYEKFAELIVKECCSIIETDLATNKIKAETDNEGRIWVNAQLTFSELIKSQFKIKEVE